jgi:hypothetical protein
VQTQVRPGQVLLHELLDIYAKHRNLRNRRMAKCDQEYFQAHTVWVETERRAVIIILEDNARTPLRQFDLLLLTETPSSATRKGVPGQKVRGRGRRRRQKYAR